MNKDRISGAAKQLKGRIKEGVGRATGDSKIKMEGKADRAAGKAQQELGVAKSKVRKVTS